MLYQRYSPVLPTLVGSYTKAGREFHASLAAGGCRNLFNLLLNHEPALLPAQCFTKCRERGITEPRYYG